MSLSVNGIIIVAPDPGIKTNILDKGAFINFRATSGKSSTWYCSIWVPLEEKDRWIDQILLPDTPLYVQHGTVENDTGKFIKIKLDRNFLKKIKKEVFNE